MPSFATPGPITAVVEVAGAEVVVTAEERADTEVSVLPIDPTRRKDVTVAEKTKIDFAGGRLTVKTTVSGERSGSVAIKINTPVGSDLIAYLAHSRLRTTGIFGDTELHLASGTVQLDSTRQLTANLSTGEVSVRQTAGRASFDGAAGTVRIDEALAPVAVNTAGGTTWIGHAAADLELESSSCDFMIDRADGNVTASTAGGTIRIGRLSGGHAKLLTGSANIEVGLAADRQAGVDVHSQRGSVRNAVDGLASPSATEVSVYARTRTGDIDIHTAR